MSYGYRRLRHLRPNAQSAENAVGASRQPNDGSKLNETLAVPRTQKTYVKPAKDSANAPTKCCTLINSRAGSPSTTVA